MQNSTIHFCKRSETAVDFPVWPDRTEAIEVIQFIIPENKSVLTISRD